MPNEKILVVEDDKDLSKLLKYNLEKEGYRVHAAADGEAGLALFGKVHPDLVLLDVMIAKLDGFEFLRSVRHDSKVPVMMLTARKDEMDRVLGFALGADDYVTKPFSVREVLARVKAVLRRVGDQAQSPSIPVLRAGELEMDVERYETKVKGKPIELTTKEFEFLKCLIQAGGRALSRDHLLEKIWGYDRSMEIDTRTIDQHIARLREKLGPEAARILTVKNVGYRLKLD
ncbi:MAG: response regulator transcription factor [Elusimicrobiota bacterium]